VTDDTHETLARSLFSSEGKKPAQRRRAAKSSELSPSAGDPESDRDPTDPTVDPAFDLAKLQATAQAWEEKYHQAQTELETLRPQLQTLQAQLEQQAKLIQEQQAAITFWQQKAQAPTPAQPSASPPAPPTLPTRPHQTLKPPLKPLAVPPTPSQPHGVDPLPDFMLD